jgi:uncharacterized membrane protein YphA (DoxX/SURF4 family)
MEMRQRIALNFPPVLLRLLLATAFIWAGLGKIMSHTEVQGERAAILANMGVIAPAPAATAASPTEPARLWSAADFAEPIRVLRVNGLALTIYSAANPAPAAGGEAPMRLWPYGLGQGRWPVYQAYAVAFTELVGGVCVLIGLMTRIWAVALGGVMLGAIWLTEIGVAIQTGDTVLGFLPNRSTFAPAEWQRLMFQFSLLMASLALAFLGAGRASLDYMLFGPPRDDDDED